MKIMSRKDARASNHNKYFTGKPCKNGHISYRYTDSGTCYDCINRSRIAANSPVALARDLEFAKMALDLAERNIFLGDLVDIALIVHHDDRDTVKAIVLGYAIARCPHVSLKEVWPSNIPKAGVRYLVRCHYDDVALIKAATTAMYEAHRPDVEAIRKHIIGEVERDVTSELGYDLKETFK